MVPVVQHRLVERNTGEVYSEVEFSTLRSGREAGRECAAPRPADAHHRPG